MKAFAHVDSESSARNKPFIVVTKFKELQMHSIISHSFLIPVVEINTDSIPVAIIVQQRVVRVPVPFT